jgi:hypothetical protein
MKPAEFILIYSLILLSCNYSKSVQKDLITGMTSQGDGLSCGNISLTMGEEVIRRNTFTYGEKFYVNFEDIEGFVKKNGNVFPDMIMMVMDKSGDVVFQAADLYSNYPGGLSQSPLTLNANLTVAAPIHSGNEYTLNIKISDKNSQGTFMVKFNFKVNPPELIKIEENKVTYDEIYLYSAGNDNVITDNNIGLNEEAYLLFEGLEGFAVDNGKVFAELSISASDAGGKMLLDESDLLIDYDKTGIDAADFKTQINSKFRFTDGDIKNPVKCAVMIRDKKSDAYVKAIFNLNLK